MTILDIGCGNGDMLRKIWKWANTHGLNLTITGIDINPLSKRSAQQRAPIDAPINFETADVFALDPLHKADFIISALFTHHLSVKALHLGHPVPRIWIFMFCPFREVGRLRFRISSNLFCSALFGLSRGGC